MTRISAAPRHSFGVRSSVQTTIETTRTISPIVNHVDEKMWKTWSRSIASTRPRPNTAS
jgi:hypothetical protein